MLRKLFSHQNIQKNAAGPLCAASSPPPQVVVQCVHFNPKNYFGQHEALEIEEILKDFEFIVFTPKYVCIWQVFTIKLHIEEKSQLISRPTERSRSTALKLFKDKGALCTLVAKIFEVLISINVQKLFLPLSSPICEACDSLHG